MKVKDLIKELQSEPADREVYLSSDSEGNTIHTIDEVAINEGDGEMLLVIYPTDTIVNY